MKLEQARAAMRDPPRPTRRRSSSRSRRARLGRAIVPAAILLALPLEASASDEPPRVGLDYRATPGCPAAGDFVAAVRARTSHVAFVEDGPTTWVFVVTLSSEASGTVGRLAVREGNGAITNPRVFRGASCAEVVDALALVAALALDPDASVARAPPPAPPATPPPIPSPDIPPPASPRAPEPKATPDPAPPRTVRVAFGGAVTGSFGEATLSGGGDAFVALEFERSTWPRWLSPELRIGFRGVASMPANVAGGTASFAWLLGSMELYPVRFPIRNLRLALGASFEAGGLEATGEGPMNAQSVLVPWGAAGGVVRLEVNPAPYLMVFAGAGASVPFVRHTFYFAPNPPGPAAETIGPVGGRVDLGAAVRF